MTKPFASEKSMHDLNNVLTFWRKLEFFMRNRYINKKLPVVINF